MIDNLLQIVAPHHCYNCQKTGTLLCDNCKYDIISDPFSGCIVCQKPSLDGVCSKCRTFYDKAWCVGERHDVLERLIDGYKFERVRGAHTVLAGLLDDILPQLPHNTVVVPIPTIAPHVRQRGYDHMLLMARQLAQMRQLTHQPVIKRVSASKQLGANRKERYKQAATAFEVRNVKDTTRPHLILDDVVTTGATLQYAAKALHEAGVQDVWVAAIARQPLDK